MATLFSNTSLSSLSDPKITTTSIQENRTDYLSLEEFIEELPNALHDKKEKENPDVLLSRKPLDGPFKDPVMKLFERVRLEDHDWAPYALFDSSKNYTRNLIATDNKTFTLLLLCWNPHCESPIHDHPCDGCWMKICLGSIQELRYEKIKNVDSPETLLDNREDDNDKNDTVDDGDDGNCKLHCTSNVVVREGEVAYITDTMGYHKVRNPSKTKPAVSMHLYCPPFQDCRIWFNEKCPPTKSRMCYYSEYGKLV